MKGAKWILAAAAVTVYVAVPAYRYYVIGAWVAHKILNDRPGRYRVVSKQSRDYKRIVGGTHHGAMAKTL
ncbi:hypothetical protein [Paenibacillus sedimenti]|uniref:Uncharacterized protein n=1 Tax=Paenibacillus sedimenti TaxID=2770274 RepID=A0A926QJ20_9BACL|nr:hypothetical protein [Paenibacillus sedimenti]MBD0381266.1 hypothetical protein [Paenibacillus sedimenti]